MLPLADNVKLLHVYLSPKAELCKQTLTEHMTAAAWSELCQITLTQIVIFNRRRAGEAQRMPLSLYTAGSSDVSEDTEGCLSEVERALCKEFRIIYIEGKHEKKVPVLLTNTTQAQINLIILKRSSVGVSAATKFLFARMNSLQPFPSSNCLRKFAQECGARNPSSVTSTKLRKHVATMSQVLALQDNVLDLLASFLGHNIKVHREFYRLPE